MSGGRESIRRPTKAKASRAKKIEAKIEACETPGLFQFTEPPHEVPFLKTRFQYILILIEEGEAVNRGQLHLQPRRFVTCQSSFGHQDHV